MSLTEEQVEILAFEKQWWRYAGAKDSAIRDTFGIDAVTYYQRLNHVIDLPEAMAADPFTVKRLRRLRDARAGQRSSRRLVGVHTQP